MTDEQKIKRLANFGFTDSGASIVDAIWFTGCYSSGNHEIGLVLIKNLEGKWKAYIGALVPGRFADEKGDAKVIADLGQKVSYGVAAGAFPNRDITEENYGGPKP